MSHYSSPPHPHPHPFHRAPAYSHRPAPSYHRSPTRSVPVPAELLVGLFLLATLALHLLGLSWPTVICHPLLSLQSVAEMVAFKFQSLKDRIGQGVEPGAWDRFGASVRGEEPDDELDGERAKVVRSYRELRVNADAGGSKGALLDRSCPSRG